jgi:hypothetical protein
LFIKSTSKTIIAEKYAFGHITWTRQVILPTEVFMLDTNINSNSDKFICQDVCIRACLKYLTVQIYLYQKIFYSVLNTECIGEEEVKF